MVSRRMRQAGIELMVGAFVLAVLVVLGISTILLSTENVFTERYETEVVFEQVPRLQAGDKVTVRGLEVGAVKRLWGEPGGVHVLLSTDQPLLMREDYSVEIIPSSVLGGQYVEVSIGSMNAVPLAPDAKIQGKTPVNFVDEASEIFAGLRQALVDDGVLNNLQESMADLRDITEMLARGEGTIGKLLSDDQAYERISTISENLAMVSQDIRDGKGSLGLLLSDETLYRDAQSAVANLKDVSTRLKDGKGLLGRLMSEDEELYSDLLQTVSSLRDVATQLREGKGSLGRFIMEEELYEEARLLLNELGAAVDDFRETSPITSFSSVFFGVF